MLPVATTAHILSSYSTFQTLLEIFGIKSCDSLREWTSIFDLNTKCIINNWTLDVTLASEEGIPVNAHRVILAL